MSALRKLGWKKNPEGVEYPKARHLLGTRPARMGALPLLAKPNHLTARGARIDQLNVSSCVAFDLTRRIQLYMALNDLGANILPAPLPIYWAGRAEEYAGTDPDDMPALVDEGTIPVNALKAVEAQGFVLWDDYEYSDDPKKVAAEPPASLEMKAYSQKGMQWGHIDEVATARIARVSDAMIHRCPVGFGITVDSSFMVNKGQRITNIDPQRLVGGHMMTVLAVLDAELIAEFAHELPVDVQPNDLLCDQWWGMGTEWGTPSGFAVISSGLFGSRWVDDVSMLEGVPPILNKKAA